MKRPAKSQDEPKRIPVLAVAREEARRRLEEHIAKGKELYSRSIATHEQLEAAEFESDKWSDRALALLNMLFDSTAMHDEFYQLDYGPILISAGPTSLRDDIETFRSPVARKINKLESIVDRLDLFQEPANLSNQSKKPQSGAQHKQINANARPRIFIGSSVEGLPIARIIQSEFQHEAEPVIWNQGLFAVGKLTFERLEEIIKEFDYSVFVFTPDDKTWKRGEKVVTVRDNVLFELGLFTGSLTRFRSFVVMPRNTNLGLPSDLLGLTTATYDPSYKNLHAAVGAACSDIRTAIQRYADSVKD